MKSATFFSLYLIILLGLIASCHSSNDKNNDKSYSNKAGGILGNWLDDFTGKWKSSNGIFTLYRNGELIFLSYKDGEEHYGKWEFNSYDTRDYGSVETLTLEYVGSKVLYRISEINSDSFLVTQAFSNDKSSENKTCFTKIGSIGLDSTNDIIRYDGIYQSKNDTSNTYLRFYGNGLISCCKLMRKNTDKNLIPEIFKAGYFLTDKKSFYLSRDTKSYYTHRRGVHPDGDTLEFTGKIIDANIIVISAIDLNRHTKIDDSFVFIQSINR